MARKNPVLTDGQVAATATALLAGPADSGARVDLCFANVGGSPETLVVTLSRSGGTQRRVFRAVLAADEQAYVRGLAVGSADTVYAATSNAASVDYTAYLAGDDAPFGVAVLDANGALKSGSASLSGSPTIAGDLAVAGGDIDAGSSGVAGSVDVFPSTASKGKLSITAADSTGNTTTTLVNASQATTRTYTIPDALAAADFLLGKQAAVARTATADGLTTGTIADAGRLQHVTVTSASADNIIVLPTPTPGTIVVLAVGATGFELRSSDPETVAINGGTEAAAESAIAADSVVVAVCVSATDWRAFFMDADGDVAKVPAAAAA